MGFADIHRNSKVVHLRFPYSSLSCGERGCHNHSLSQFHLSLSPSLPNPVLPNFSFTDLLPGIPFPDLALDPTAQGSD